MKHHPFRMMFHNAESRMKNAELYSVAACAKSMADVPSPQDVSTEQDKKSFIIMQYRVNEQYHNYIVAKTSEKQV